MSVRFTRRHVRRATLALLVAIAIGTVVTTRAQSPSYVYVGTYTAATTPGSGSLGIYVYRFDEATGALSAAGLAGETPSPSFLTASTDGRSLFAVNELQTANGSPGGLVTSFAINRTSGTLSKLSVQPSGGAGPCHLALDKTGRWLAVANYGGGNYALLPVSPDGTLGPPTSVVAGEPTSGPDGKPLRPLGHMVGFDASNRYLLASDKGLNKLLVFRFDDRSGMLTPNAVPSVAMPQPGSGPRHFAFDRDERFLFSIAEQAATITTFAWNAASGTLTARGSVPTRPSGITTGSTAEIATHPFGPFVYGSNRGHDSIAVFRIGATGDLTLVEHEPTRGTTPRGFGIDPAGRWLIAANQGSGSLAVFSIDDRTGALDAVGPTIPIDAPVSVVFVK